MTSLLIIIVLVLLAIALWQLTKIFDLTQVGSDLDDSQVASDDDNNFQGYLMFGFSLYIHIYNLWSVYMGPLHTPASAHGAEVDNLMNITWILIFIVQAITQVLLYYFAFKYRGEKIERRYISLIISWRHFECYSVILAG
jgi:cytochrome c oxidase subunit 2